MKNLRIYKSLVDANLRKEIADYIIEKDATVRQAKVKFKISKSTIHKHMSIDLKNDNLEKYEEVQKVFQKHKDERASLGGLALKKKRELKK